MNLRSKVIRLAYARPDLRPDLLPLLTKKADMFDMSDRAQELLDAILDEMKPSKNLNEAMFEAAVYTASGALLDDLYLHEGRYIKDEDYINNPNIRWERVLESLEEVLGGHRKYLLLLQEGWPGTSGRLIKTRKVPGDPNIKDLIAEFVQVTGGDPKSLDQLNAEIYYRLEGFDWRFSGSFRRIAEVYDQIRQWDWYNTDSYFHTHRRPSLRGKWAGVLQDYARHARNALKEHERERYVDDDYRRTMQEFIDMERDALPNAKKTRGGQKALEDIREEKAKSDRVFARR